MSLLQALNLPRLPAQAGAAGRKQARLAEAAADWRAAHVQADGRIEALKAAIQSHYAGEHPALLAEIEKGVGKLDGVLDTVDQRLADLLASAGKAADEAARAKELASAKALLTEHIGFVKREQLIAHIDRNPFGIKTDLRGLLVTALTRAAQAIG